MVVPSYLLVSNQPHFKMCGPRRKVETSYINPTNEPPKTPIYPTRKKTKCVGDNQPEVLDPETNPSVNELQPPSTVRYHETQLAGNLQIVIHEPGAQQPTLPN